MTQTLADIAAQLEEPFAIGDIDLLPKGKTERDGRTLCMALPYADVRVYEDRLNKLAPGEWSTPPPMAIVVGQKLVVYVSVVVCGVVHTDVGEAAAGGENAATESWAQEFKRACSQFGLGRYLYDLDKAWVPYNVQRKQIALSASDIQSVVRKMYSDARVTAEPATDGTSQHATPARITEPQENSIRKLCEHLDKSPDALISADTTYGEAKQMIQELTTEYRTLRVTPPAGAVQPKAVLDMIARAKERTERVHMVWDAVKRDTFGGKCPADETLTVQMVAQINGVLTVVEKGMVGAK